MLKKFLCYTTTLLCISCLFYSCANLSKLENKKWHEIDPGTQNEIQQTVNALTAESATYALLRLKNFTIENEDLFTAESPIYTNRSKIPAMNKRMDILSERIKTLVQNNATEYHNILSSYLIFGPVTKNPLKLLFSIQDSYLLSELTEHYPTIKKELYNYTDALLAKNEIYAEWDSIYTTYENWRLNIENIAKISKQEIFETAIKRDLLSIITDAIYHKWTIELAVGERLTKQTAQQNQNESIRKILWEIKEQEQ